MLPQARELKIRDPEVASAYGLELLASHGRSLGAEERWLLHEQARCCLACLLACFLAFHTLVTRCLRRIVFGET